MAATEVIRSERFPDLDDEVMFPRLSDAKLEWLGEARRAAHLRARRGALRARRPRRALLRARSAAWSSSSTASRARTSTSRRPTAARSSATSRRSPASRRSARASPSSRPRRDRLRPRRAAQDGRPLAGVRRAHLPHAAGPARLARSRGLRGDAADRPAQLASRLRGARPARAQPAARCAGTTSTPTPRARRCSTGSRSRARRRRSSSTRPR